LIPYKQDPGRELAQSQQKSNPQISQMTQKWNPERIS
jgi:hypothetical protein